MPVTTRAAASRAQHDGHAEQTKEQPTPAFATPGKTARKRSSRQKRKQVQVQPTVASDQPAVFAQTQQQSTSLPGESKLDVIDGSNSGEKNLEKDSNANLESTFSSQAPASSTNGKGEMTSSEVNR